MPSCRAQDDSDLRAQVQTLQQQVTALSQQVQTLQQKLDQRPAPALPAPVVTDMVPKAPAASTSAGRSQLVAPASSSHGFFERKPGDKVTFYVPGGELTTYANLDVSVEATTKGLAGEIGPDGNPPVGNMGWMPALSTNLSYFGIRGFQSLNGLPVQFIYQLETQIDIAATSGSAETNSNQSNVVKGGLTSRNSYIGISSPRWGSLMLGKLSRCLG